MNLEHLTGQHRYVLHNRLGDVEAEMQREIALIHTHRTMRTITPHLGHKTDFPKPKLHLAEYLPADGATPPERLHRGLFKGYTDPLGNTDWGNCGDCMVFHGLEGIQHASGNPISNVVTADSLNLYSKEGGFNINAGPSGNNPTDNGTDNAQLFPYWQNPGITVAADNSTHKIEGFVWVQPGNRLEQHVGIYEFCATFSAYNMPTTAQGQTEWSVTDPSLSGNAAPGSWGGHDVVKLAYDVNTDDVDSWGMWIPVEEEFDTAYQSQCIVIVTTEMRRRSGTSPTGFDWTKFNADFNALVGGGPSD